jgi:hypothetical protein
MPQLEVRGGRSRRLRVGRGHGPARGVRGLGGAAQQPCGLDEFGARRAIAALTEATDLRDAGVHYVRFAREHSAHFQVMFTPELLRENDLELTTARALTADRLRQAVSDRVPEPGTDPRLANVAAWSLAHGFATLLLGHNLDGAVGGQDPEEVFRTLTGMLFQPPST